METIDLDDPAEEAFWSRVLSSACGAPLSVDLEGSVRIKVFEDRHGDFRREIDKWFIRMRVTNTATGESLLIRDVGPDIIWVNREGDLLLAFTGRSVTGSGLIGRAVLNLTTFEFESRSGRELGDWIDNVCAELG